jgi:tRNA-intron endonuclease
MDQKDEKREPEEEKKVPIKATLREDGVFVQSTEDVEGLSSRGYGTKADEGVTLTFYEALFLLGKGIIEVTDEKTRGSITFQDLLGKYRVTNENAWVKYLIYRDLRSRGYVVREGFGLGIDFRVYERGEYGEETADYLVVGIHEGQPVILEDLARTLKHVQSLKKILILAVLNRRGEIVYYTLSRLTFE